MIKKVSTKFNARILVVDDYVDNRELAKSLLELMDCEVDVVEDGREAIEMVKQTKYDAIFMDVQMPEMDGYHATRAIRMVEGNSGRTPIIALTANALMGDDKKCLKAGMDDYIAKPFKGEDIEKALVKFLSKVAEKH
ncbi:MAG: response regulator [Proteobacteria bacterium]|nr:response regulator [Pseudomonadota bacterium]